jgi:hypothetical protein
MNALEMAAADAVHNAIQNASNSTARSQQQQDFRLGSSNIGHCRNYAALLTKQTPFSDVRDKTAAFMGTVLGKAVEDQLQKEHPDWFFQSDGVFRIPSGGELPGHPDIVIPASAGASVEEILASLEDADYDGPALFMQGVWDLKSKAEMEAIKRNGQTLQQKFQLTQYASMMIDAGHLDPTKPIFIADVFFDRSAQSQETWCIGEFYDPDVVAEIDEWINDVKYAVAHNEDASRDMPREFCWNWCEYATVCRGNDTDVEGLLEDPAVFTAVEMFEERKVLMDRAKALEKGYKTALAGVAGSTGQHMIRNTWVNPVEMPASKRAGYFKLSITPVTEPKPKPKRAAKKQTAEELLSAPTTKEPADS